MKNIIVIMLLAVSANSFGQSESFLTLKEKFADSGNVTSLKVGGFLIRAVLWFGDEKETEGLRDISSIRLMNIPQHELASRNLKLSGFKKLLARDNFEEVVSVKEKGDLITVYVQDHGKSDNYYMMLVESDTEITAIEIEGDIDPAKLVDSHCKGNLSNL